MSTIFGVPRPESPMVDASGKINRDWYMFLSYLFQLLGGPAVTTATVITASDMAAQFEEYPISNPDAQEALRGVDELRNALDSTRSELQSIRTLLDGLTTSIEGIRPATDYRNRIESLEDRLA